MDSTAATSIVNKINLRLDMNLPRNACHTHADLGALTTAILEMLRLVETEQPVVFGLVSHVGDHLADDIVIVGQALRLPGGSLDLDTPESFWEALVTMREDLLVSPKRWDHASFRRPSGAPPAPGDITFDKAGFIKIESFDNSFFGISSAEAMFISPATRLALETTFQALENANIPISRLKGTDTGIFVAGMDVCYEQLLFASQGFDCQATLCYFFSASNISL
jgi:acyl transferase domain-containing protein